ncbi:MAG: glutathione peroxidase [Ignavibacteria bacterium]|nr:glutathione peroxidase [Ignavibacteria bacterium]MBT8381076.1 glutathione peroxidase [Ignavibacteria bacterium]MBT8392338.1 glutathione peroxidase [Ignavibacteria bacterium]NNJ53252.1 glutathione peroxidase [Ignavibacteriaceae bacterium]NNL19974.1 glutathione peroxidase [Ignavibacteriaceae bacterium]
MISLFTSSSRYLSSSEKSANISDYTVKDINLNEVKLSYYKGKVLLIVNVASKCGFTSQYKSLQKIYETYKNRGFAILGFPCNDFGGQEPGTNEEIKSFCSLNYDVTFPIFDKVHVKGDEKAPLFDLLTNNTVTGKSSIKWNFEKFLIDKDGNIVDRFRSVTKPENKKITSLIEKELGK